MIKSEDKIVLVDERDKEIGIAPKAASHHRNTPLHRGFSCFIFNRRGHFLLTRRSKSKGVFPGIWTNSVCGHPRPGEELDLAVRRRAMEELGMDLHRLELAVPFFRYKARSRGVLENEICPVYVAFSDDTPEPNPEEVEDFLWISWTSFVGETKARPWRYSLWSRRETQLLVGNDALRRFTGQSFELIGHRHL